MKICPRCGEETENFYENLCLKCYIEKLKEVKIKFRQCKYCKKFFVSNKIFENFDDAKNFYIEKYLKKKYQIIEKIPEEKFKFEIKDFLCEKCKEVISSKVEAILQLRGELKTLNKIMNIFKLEGRRVKNGFDIDFKSKDDLKKIFGFLKRNFKIEHNISRKLVGLKDGKRKYKDTVLVRIYGRK